MDMKKICCAVVMIAATISCVLAVAPATDAVATGGVATTAPSLAPGPAATGEASGATGTDAPGPAASGAAQTLQAFGSFVGASLLSFLTYYLQY